MTIAPPHLPINRITRYCTRVSKSNVSTPQFPSTDARTDPCRVSFKSAHLTIHQLPVSIFRSALLQQYTTTAQCGSIICYTRRYSRTPSPSSSFECSIVGLCSMYYLLPPPSIVFRHRTGTNRATIWSRSKESLHPFASFKHFSRGN